MKITLSNSEALEIAKKMDRLHQFGYEGWELLIEYMDELEDMQEEEIEFDVIAICCDFTRYENLKEFQDSYGEEYETIEDIEEDAQVLYIEKEYCTEIHDYKLTDAFIVSNF